MHAPIPVYAVISVHSTKKNSQYQFQLQTSYVYESTGSPLSLRKVHTARFGCSLTPRASASSKEIMSHGVYFVAHVEVEEIWSSNLLNTYVK
jgi:hypothetical protein